MRGAPGGGARGWPAAFTAPCLTPYPNPCTCLPLLTPRLPLGPAFSLQMVAGGQVYCAAGAADVRADASAGRTHPQW